MATNLKSGYADIGTFYGILNDENGLVLLAVGTGAPSGGGAVPAIGCIAVNATNGAMYINTGSAGSPSWTLMGVVTAGSVGANELASNAVTSVKILAGAVTLAKLAAGITPSDVPKYSGTVTWSGSGATLAASVTGVASTDRVVATIRVAPTQAAYLVSVVPTTDTLTFTLSAANTSNQAQISYEVFRTAA